MSKSPTTAKSFKPDLSEHEEEAVPCDELMQKLVKAKPVPKKVESNEKEAKSDRK